MVRCYDCGLLAAPYRSEGTLEEVPKFSRDSGSPTRTSRGFPVCLALAFDLPQEYEHRSVSRAGTSAGITPADVVPVLHRERECDDFTTWRQGFSPKDHVESRDRNAEREWREQVEKRNQRYRIIELSIVVAASFLTAAAILLAAFIPLFLR